MVSWNRPWPSKPMANASSRSMRCAIRTSWRTSPEDLSQRRGLHRLSSATPTKGNPMRLDYHSLAPKSSRLLAQLSHSTGTLDKRLKELVNLRISQINGCAFCIDMHWADLVKQGMDPRHINAVAGWPE